MGSVHDQLGLFPDAPALLPIPGLRFVAEAVDEMQEAELERNIDAAPLTPFEFGPWEGKRLTMSYGSAYDFLRARTIAAPPMPGWLAELCRTLAPLVDSDPRQFTQA